MIVFACSRALLAVNNSTIVFFLMYAAGFTGSTENPTSVNLAVIPFLANLSSSLFCMYAQRPMTQYFGDRTRPTFLGFSLIALSGAPMYFINNPNVNDEGINRNIVYPLVAIQGIGISIVLNVATSCISDVLGHDTKNSSFVVGIYSIAEKILNGVSLKIIFDNFI